MRAKLRSTQSQHPKSNVKQPSKRFEKAQFSVKSKLLGIIVCGVLGYYAWQGYLQYQAYQEVQQQKINHLLLENQQIAEKQRAVHGSLPEHFLSEQGRKNLGI